MLTWNDILKITQKQSAPRADKLVRSEQEWKNLLAPDVYYVTRQKGTERAFSSEMCHYFSPGRYRCACCEEVLFDANTKFDSGTGWPSFTKAYQEDAISYHADNGLFMQRVEVCCARCDAHLGHVFPDGPPPSHLRYCINALSLVKIEN